jgi:hypothetical protein
MYALLQSRCSTSADELTAAAAWGRVGHQRKRSLSVIVFVRSILSFGIAVGRRKRCSPDTNKNTNSTSRNSLSVASQRFSPARAFSICCGIEAPRPSARMLAKVGDG